MLDRNKLNELMSERYEGNYSKFARELGVDPSHVHRFLRSGIGGGKKMLGAVRDYCRSNGLTFEDYLEN